MNPVTATVLLVSPNESDHRALGNIFSHCRWQLHSVRTCAEARDLLYGAQLDVVLADADLDRGRGWKTLLAGLLASGDAPPLIVTSGAKDESLWAEVLNLGGFDVLLKPFDSTEVFRVVSFAWRQSHDRRRAGRRHARAGGSS